MVTRTDPRLACPVEVAFFGYLYMDEIMTIRTVLPFGYKHIKEVPTAMAVSFITLWSLWAFLLLVLFLKSAFAHQAEVVFRRDME